MNSRPTDAAGWRDYYQARADKLAAQQAREQKQQKPPDTRLHPLLAPPSFPEGTHVDVQMHFIDSHIAHREQAEDIVRERRKAVEAERRRRDAPHPHTQPPFVHLPLPPARKRD
jgi:hypothetical protein